jgi:hypothetical protein
LGTSGVGFALIGEDQHDSAWRIDKARMMARPRKPIPLEEGLKLDLNKLAVQAIMKGGPIQQVICWNPRYSGDARTI